MKGKDNFEYIFDAYAILAHLGNEAGADEVKIILQSAEKAKTSIGISIINYGEVAYIVEKQVGFASVHEVLAVLESLPITIIPADEVLVMTAAHIKANYAVSYADAFAIATTQLYGGKLVTGDPEMREVDGKIITVEWLPHNK
jgi:uncharacterized protein